MPNYTPTLRTGISNRPLLGWPNAQQRSQSAFKIPHRRNTENAHYEKALGFPSDLHLFGEGAKQMAQKPRQSAWTATGAQQNHPSKWASVKNPSECTKERHWSTLHKLLGYFKPLIPLLSLKICRTRDWRMRGKNLKIAKGVSSGILIHALKL